MSFIRNAALAASFSVIAIAAMASLARAHDYSVGGLAIGHPWTRATPPAARVAAGYLTIENKGSQPDRLVAAAFDGSGAVEIHEMAMDGGVMRMRELPKGIEIGPGRKVELKPGGLHLMFTNLKAGLRQGDSARGALVFERAGRIEVEFKVEPIGHGGGHDQRGHDHHGHGATPKVH